MGSSHTAFSRVASESLHCLGGGAGEENEEEVLLMKESKDQELGTSTRRSMLPSKVRPLPFSLAAGMRPLKARTSTPGLKPTELRAGGGGQLLAEERLLPRLLKSPPPAVAKTEEFMPLAKLPMEEEMLAKLEACARPDVKFTIDGGPPKLEAVEFMEISGSSALGFHAECAEPARAKLAGSVTERVARGCSSSTCEVPKRGREPKMPKLSSAAAATGIGGKEDEKEGTAGTGLAEGSAREGPACPKLSNAEKMPLTRPIECVSKEADALRPRPEPAAAHLDSCAASAEAVSATTFFSSSAAVASPRRTRASSSSRVSHCPGLTSTCTSPVGLLSVI